MKFKGEKNRKCVYFSQTGSPGAGVGAVTLMESAFINSL